MFGANRKKFLEGGVESEYGDDSSLYYSQQSMFPPHRSDKEVSPFFCFAAVIIAGISVWTLQLYVVADGPKPHET